MFSVYMLKRHGDRTDPGSPAYEYVCWCHYAVSYRCRLLPVAIYYNLDVTIFKNDGSLSLSICVTNPGKNNRWTRARTKFTPDTLHSRLSLLLYFHYPSQTALTADAERHNHRQQHKEQLVLAVVKTIFQGNQLVTAVHPMFNIGFLWVAKYALALRLVTYK